MEKKEPIENLPILAPSHELGINQNNTGILLTSEQLKTPGGFFLSTFVEFLTSLEPSGKFSKWNIFEERGLPTNESTNLFHHFIDTYEGHPIWSEGQSLVKDILESNNSGHGNVFRVNVRQDPERGEILQLLFSTQMGGRPAIWKFEVSPNGKFQDYMGHGSARKNNQLPDTTKTVENKEK